MNERIRELHIQAQQEAFNEPIDIENCAVEDIKGFSQQVYEKFAELIVGECIRKINDIAESSNNPQPIYRVAVDLLEHFGVTE
jgi:hypothetical protein